MLHMCQARKLTHVLVFRNLGCSHISLCLDSIFLTSKTPVPLNAREKTSTYQKSHCQNKLIQLIGSAWAKASGMQSNLIIRLKDYLQKVGQELVLKKGLSLACPGFDQSRLAELILSFQCSLNNKVTNQSAISL